MNHLIVIRSIINKDWDRLQNISLVISLFCACVIVATVLDFFAGVEKAKQRGEDITASGFSRTLTKLKNYFIFLILAVAIDCITSLWYGLPIVSGFAAIAMVLIETKSIFEQKKQNWEIAQIPQMFATLFENKDKFTAFMKAMESQSNINLDGKNESDSYGKTQKPGHGSKPSIPQTPGRR